MSAYERVLDRLAEHALRVWERGDRARAQCTVHGSRGLTLAVFRNDSGAGLHCHAGCDNADIAAALGLSLRDLFDNNRTTDRRRPVTPPRARTKRDHRLIPDVGHLCGRIEQQERLEAQPAYWLRRADAFAAVGNPACDAIALACRRHATLLCSSPAPVESLAELIPVAA